MVFIFIVVGLSTSQVLAEPQKIKFIYSDNNPPSALGAVFFKQEWVPRINKMIAPDYKLDITYYHASSLYKYQDQTQALEDGLIDMGTFIVTYELARAPLHEVVTLPFIGTGMDAHATNKIWFKLQETIPEFNAEFSKYKELLHFSSMPRIINATRILRVPDDFKGVKVLSTGLTADVFRSIGAVPIMQPPPDWYTSLDRGLAEAISTGIGSVTMFKLDEVVKYHVNFPGENLGWVGIAFIMNRQRYEGLPLVLQKAIDDNVKWASERITQLELDKIPLAEEICRKRGNIFVDLTPEEMQKWRDAVKPIHEAWIAKMEEKGLPGKKVFDKTIQLANEYTK